MRSVTISATDATATYWLKPLIDSFRAVHSKAGFVVLVSDEHDMLRNYSGVDLALLCGNERCEVGGMRQFPEMPDRSTGTPRRCALVEHLLASLGRQAAFGQAAAPGMASGTPRE